MPHHRAETAVPARFAKHLARLAPTLALLAAVLTPHAAAAPPPLGAAGVTAPLPNLADVVARVAPAVVNVSSSQTVGGAAPSAPMPNVPPGSPFEDFFRDFFDRNPNGAPAQRRASSLGSGFVIDPAGFVVTNNHVVGEADRITVSFADEEEHVARLIGTDPKTDLALLKIEDPGPFPYVEFGDSEGVRVGDWIIAIGNPFGLGSSVTAGIISARGRDIRAGPYDDFLQIDAPINRGNSGGPTFTLDGKVLGVNTAIFSPSGGSVGIGFAIPANLARPVIASLKRFGEVRRGWLGVRIQTVTEDIARGMGLPDADGALVASVTPGGPAEEGSIEPGDVILAFDGKKLQRMRSLPRIVAETEIGRTVDVEVFRRGERRTLRATVAELPEEAELAEAEIGRTPGGETGSMRLRIEGLGVTLGSLTDDARTRFRLNREAEGVVVLDVAPGGPAARERLEPGDLIAEVEQEPVGSPPEVMARVQSARENGRRAVLLLVNRRGDLRFVALPLA